MQGSEGGVWGLWWGVRGASWGGWEGAILPMQSLMRPNQLTIHPPVHPRRAQTTQILFTDIDVGDPETSFYNGE